VDELVERGHSVTLFGSGDCETRGELVAVSEACLTALMAEGRAGAFEHYANAAVTEALKRSGDFDVVHFHLTPGWLPLAALSRCPSLFTLHTCAVPDDEWAFARYPQVEVAGISHYQVRETEARLGRRFPVVYNGCDFGAYAVRAEPGEYLAFLGRMSHAKNPLGAIEVAAAVGLPLVLAGQPQNAEEQRYFEREILPRVDGDRVRWIGPVNHEQKAAFLQKASALLFPIQWDEPFGLVMIEAMACGTPVLGVRRGSVAEVITPGVTGYAADRPEDLSRHVEAALALDRVEVRRAAEARFGYRTMVDGYEALYRNLMGRAAKDAR
jgi:glycosyltransferase involved in cell wall biosynthesis